jgi:hypothetical protein
MTERKLEARLRDYAKAAALDASHVVSLKLRAVMPGAHYTDLFGHQDANAYTYDSEYEAGRAVTVLSKAPDDAALASPSGESVIVSPLFCGSNTRRA